MTGAATPAHWAWFRHDVAGEPRLGVFDPAHERHLDLGPRDERQPLCATASDLAAWAAEGVELALPSFRVPYTSPSKILCLGKNFAAHAAEFGAEVPEEPIFFTKFAETLLPHGQTIVLPHWVETRIDHELELAVILGFDDPECRGKKYVAAEDAMTLVGGVTILNDVTARRIQGDDRKQQRPWLRSKSFDTFCPMGPYVVPAAQVDVSAGLAMQLHVGDELRQESSTDLMVVDIPHAIEFLSRHTTLRPGDILAMGTPAGVGPIEAGDRVRCWIESLGTLENPVTRETAP